MAVWRRRPKASALLHHSDQGSQYSNELYQKLLADNGVQCSMSRTGNVWDNSAMESFFSSLKIERIHGRRYRTRDEARSDIFDYIECFLIFIRFLGARPDAEGARSSPATSSQRGCRLGSSARAGGVRVDRGGIGIANFA
jgi:transposase InsO family protein